MSTNGHLDSRASEEAEDLRSVTQDVIDVVTNIVRERPMTILLGAVALGALVAAMRWRS